MPQIPETSALARRPDMLSLPRLSPLLLALCVCIAEAEREEVIGILGSSVLLDPKIAVDSGKNEILWTFKADNKSLDVLLDHIPGVATLELSEQFKNRLRFNASNGALMINGLEASDEGDYTFSIDKQELKIIQLLIIAKTKEMIGILGSSVLLDPKITVDPNKNEILWTFITGNKSLEVVLDHIPGLATMEPSEQFKNRLQFFASYGGLMIKGLKASDQGNYIFTVDNQELKVIQLLLIAKMKEVVGVPGSSVLLDPELKVDPSKNEIVWTFITEDILLHKPGHTAVEPSKQFESRLQFNTYNGALTVNGLEPRDQGDYTFIVDGQEMKIIQLLHKDKLSEATVLTNFKALGSTIQLTCDVSGDPDEYQWWKDGGEIPQHHQIMNGNRTLVIQSTLISDCGMYTCVAANRVSSVEANYTLVLYGLSINDGIIVVASTAGLVISSASLHPVMLLDHWRWKTLGAFLGIAFNFLGLAICNIMVFSAIIIVSFYWTISGGISPLVSFMVGALITGLLLSSAYINTFVYLLRNRRSDRETFQRTKIWLKWLSDSKVSIYFLNVGLPVIQILEFSFNGTVLAVGITGLVLVLALFILFTYKLQKINTEQGESSGRTRSWLTWPFICTDILHLAIHIPPTFAILLKGLSFKDVVAVAMTITSVLLPLVVFIPLVHLLWKLNSDQEAFLRVKRWLSICKAVFFIVVLIAFISWMAITDLTQGDIVIIAPSIMGLVLSTAYAFIFLCWTWKGFPEDKRWIKGLIICNDVSLVTTLIAFICWIVFKGERCDSNFPTWILLVILMLGFVITLSRAVPVCHCGEKGTNRDNCAEREQNNGEGQELQTISLDHEDERENLQPEA